MHAVCCLLPADLSPALSASSVCEFCLLSSLFWYCFLSLLTQEHKVSLLKTFVEVVGSSFLSTTAFKLFQNKFSLHYKNIHHIMIGTIFLLFLRVIFIYFHSCNTHFGTCYHSVCLWQQTGVSFASSSIAIYPICAVPCCISISCSFSKLFRCRVHTIHFEQPSPSKTSTFDVKLFLIIWMDYTMKLAETLD